MSDLDPPARSLTPVDALAVFSCGFLLLPGVAAAVTGTSAVVAYVVAGLLASIIAFGLLFVDWPSERSADMGRDLRRRSG
ncbi:MAG: hypothetical protein AAFV53_35355 [Myxococcota bacterium]